MLKALSLLSLFGASLGVIMVSSIMVAFTTNSLPITLIVSGIEITAFFALVAKVDIELNK